MAAEGGLPRTLIATFEPWAPDAVVSFEAGLLTVQIAGVTVALRWECRGDPREGMTISAVGQRRTLPPFAPRDVSRRRRDQGGQVGATSPEGRGDLSDVVEATTDAGRGDQGEQVGATSAAGRGDLPAEVGAVPPAPPPSAAAVVILHVNGQTKAGQLSKVSTFGIAASAHDEGRPDPAVFDEQLVTHAVQVAPRSSRQVAPTSGGRSPRLRAQLAPTLSGEQLRHSCAAVAEILAAAIREHTPSAVPRPENWLEEIRLAITNDGVSPFDLAMAARYAHSAADQFWRRKVASGKTLRSSAIALITQASTRSAADRGSPVLRCPDCALIVGGEPEPGMVCCEHSHVWARIHVWHCPCGTEIVSRRSDPCPPCADCRVPPADVVAELTDVRDRQARAEGTA